MALNEVKMSDQPKYKRNIAYWVSYDLGNTIYSMVVVSLTIQGLIYYFMYTGGSGVNAVNNGNLFFAVTLFLGNVLMAMFSPFLGAYADNQTSRKRLLFLLSSVCMLFMAMLSISAFLPTGELYSVIIILTIFLIANVGYQCALVVYDSMLPFIADKEHVAKTSGLGVAIGYFGSFIAIGVSFILDARYGKFIMQAETETTSATFQLGYAPYIYPLAAILFLLFALPLFMWLKEKNRVLPEKSLDTLKAEVIKQVKSTGSEIKNKNKDMFWFLVGWLIFVDAANTIIAYMAVLIQIGLEFGDQGPVFTVLGIGIMTAVLGTYPIGMYVTKKGPRSGLKLVFSLWLVAIIIGFFTNFSIGNQRTPSELVYLVGIFTGPALGGTWVVQRQYVVELAPPERVGNYFGFSNIFGRISAAIGPLVWFVSVLFFTQTLKMNAALGTRYTLLTVGILVVLGFLIIYLKVRDPHKIYLAGGRAVGDGTYVDNNNNQMTF